MRPKDPDPFDFLAVRCATDGLEVRRTDFLTVRCATDGLEVRRTKNEPTQGRYQI